MRPSNLFVGSLIGLTLLAILSPTLRLLEFPSFVHQFIDISLIVLANLWVATITIDVVHLRNRRELEARREMSSTLAVGHDSRVQLSVRHNYERSVKMVIQDRCPLELNPKDSVISQLVPARSTVQYEYLVHPIVRGNFELDYVDITYDSILGFWQRIVRVPVKNAVRVYPDFAQISRYLQILLAHQTLLIGLRKQHRRGTGLDFHQLREYRQGDQLNHIDWKTTSKRRALISREFQDERSQQLLFLVDTGKRMHSGDEVSPLFDQALDAMLLLSYIALQQGDGVSVYCFGHMTRWIPELKGLSSITRMLHRTYDLQTGTYASDYIEAAENALARHRKRSLVVLLTSFRDDDKDLPGALKLLSTRHLVMLANLHESLIDRMYTTDVDTTARALSVLGIAKYIQERARVIAQCKGSCRVVLESKPKDLPINMVNAYWSLKRSGQF
ncbi:MAG: DUF58 domain-containing protein [Gammaproteobacteria bacterium]|nr:DUF58 domain-containing protein [Gammaproteobacteria bacterium]MYF38530.1 DUF58 domain-containing protein [Gammaproteobacteria bacterium]